MYGARFSLLASFVAVGVGVGIGFLPGLLAGYYSGSTDWVVMRFIEALMAFPPIILAIAVVAAIGPGLDELDDRRRPRVRPPLRPDDA